jgi:hypothetical protein
VSQGYWSRKGARLNDGSAQMGKGLRWKGRKSGAMTAEAVSTGGGITDARLDCSVGEMVGIVCCQ